MGKSSSDLGGKRQSRFSIFGSSGGAETSGGDERVMIVKMVPDSERGRWVTTINKYVQTHQKLANSLRAGESSSEVIGEETAEGGYV